MILWAGLVFGLDALGILPQIGGASAQVHGPSAWSWVLAGAGLLGLLGDTLRVAFSDWPDPSAWDYV